MRRLWLASVADSAGEDIGRTLLPIIALDSLHAGPSSVAILNSIGLLGFVGAGVLASRAPSAGSHAYALMRADMLRGLAYGAIPLAHWMGVLTIVESYVVATIVGIGDLLSTTSITALLAGTSEAEGLGVAFSRLATLQNTARIVSPAIGGLAVVLVGASGAILLAALAYGCGAIVISSARLPKSIGGTAGNPAPRRLDGLRLAWQNRWIRSITMSSALLNAGTMAGGAVLVAYVIDTLGASPGFAAALPAFGAAGGALGGLAAAKIRRRYGLGATRALLGLLMLPATLIAPAAPSLPGRNELWLVLSECLVGMLATIVSIAGAEVVPLLVPGVSLPRVVAGTRIIIIGVIPLAGGAAAVLAQVCDLRVTLCLGALVSASSTIPIFVARMHKWSDVPEDLVVRN